MDKEGYRTTLGVKRVVVDRAYDSNENLRYLYNNGIEAAIKVRKNSWHDRSYVTQKFIV